MIAGKAVAKNPNLDLRRRLDKLIAQAEQGLQGTAEHYSSPYHGDYPLGGRFRSATDVCDPDSELIKDLFRDSTTSLAWVKMAAGGERR